MDVRVQVIVAPVIDFHGVERDIAQNHIKAVVLKFGGFISRDGNIRIRIKLLCDSAGDGIQLYAKQLAPLKLLRQHRIEFAGSHTGVQDFSVGTTFKAKPFQSAVNVPDQVRLGVVGCDGGLQLLIFVLPTRGRTGESIGKPAPSDITGKDDLFFRCRCPLFQLNLLEQFDCHDIVFIFGFCSTWIQVIVLRKTEVVCGDLRRRRRLTKGRQISGGGFIHNSGRLCCCTIAHSHKGANGAQFFQLFFQPVLRVLQIVHVGSFLGGEDSPTVQASYISVKFPRNIFKVILYPEIVGIGLFIHHGLVQGRAILGQIPPYNFLIGILPLQIAEHLGCDTLTAVVLQNFNHADMGPPLKNTVPDGSNRQLTSDRLHQHINLPMMGVQGFVQNLRFLRRGFRSIFYRLRGCHAAGVGVDYIQGNPIRFFRQLGIQFPHFLNLCIHAACPQMLFCPLSRPQKILAVSTQTV